MTSYSYNNNNNKNENSLVLAVAPNTIITSNKYKSKNSRSCCYDGSSTSRWRSLISVRTCVLAFAYYGISCLSMANVYAHANINNVNTNTNANTNHRMNVNVNVNIDRSNHDNDYSNRKNNDIYNNKNINMNTHMRLLETGNSPSSSPSQSPLEDSQVSNVRIELTGVEPLTPDDQSYFQSTMSSYIESYFNGTVGTGTLTPLQQNIYDLTATIELQSMDPPYVQPTSTSNTNKNLRNRHRHLLSNTLTIKYKQSTSYRNSNPDFDVLPSNLVTEPFSNVILRYNFVNLLKSNTDRPAFSNLDTISYPYVPTPSPTNNNTDTSTSSNLPLIIGIIGGVAGSIIITIAIFYFCKKRKNKSIYFTANHTHTKTKNNYHSNGPALSNNHNQTRNNMGMAAGAQILNSQSRQEMARNRADIPSQLNFPENGDDISTMIDPPPQAGVFTNKQDLDGYGGGDQSVGTMDYDYTRTYGGGADMSIVSSVGCTIGENSSRGGATNLYSTNESVLTPAGFSSFGGGTNDDNTSSGFEAHLKARKLMNGQTLAGANGASPSMEEIIHVTAPPGKLGLVIDTPPDAGAPTIFKIKDTCPIADQLRIGDKFIAVDGQDVRSRTAVQVSRLISNKSGQERKFTISRTTVRVLS